MAERSYKYKDFVNKVIAALNNSDFETLFYPSDFSPYFTKHSLPQSRSPSPQSREQWLEDLTSKSEAQNYKERHTTIVNYWENVEKRSAIVWCTETGILVDGERYEKVLMMRYEFDRKGKLGALWEHTDSKMQGEVWEEWVKREEGKKGVEGEKVDRVPEKKAGNHDRFYLLTYPRTASNLLVRILALDEQPKVAMRETGGYFFLPQVVLAIELKLRGKHVREWTEGERSQMMSSYQNCFNELEEHLRTAKADGKMVFVKEHSCFMTEPTTQSKFVFGQDSVQESPWTVHVPSRYALEGTRSSLNETVLPDEFLRTWLPTFLIRHPALVFPSHYRTVRDLEGVEAARKKESSLTLMMTLHFTRTLYEWYAKELSKPESDSASDSDVTWPLILDADDVMTEPEVIIRFCEIVGMDPTKLRSEWTPANEEELRKFPNDVERRMRSTLLASAGVMKGKTSIKLDIATEAKKWREEFGEREGERIEEWVRAAMPDYEFMKAKRLRRKMRS